MWLLGRPWHAADVLHYVQSQLGRQYRTPIEIARRNILQSPVCPQAAEVYGVLIPKADNLQERHFSRLHEIILGLTAGSIEDEIHSNRAFIETMDVYGWTPLHWAVRRNDAEAVKVLLRSGANPFTETGDDHASPIHLAARADSAWCVWLLLQHRHGGKAMDMNGWDNTGRMPLRIAAGNNCGACTALLIELGAELDNLDRQNETALLSAVYESAHETIPLLIKASASTTAMTCSRNSILHLRQKSPPVLGMLGIVLKSNGWPAESFRKSNWFFKSTTYPIVTRIAKATQSSSNSRSYLRGKRIAITMGNCMSSTAEIKKAEKEGYYGLPSKSVPSAEAQLDELLRATGTQRRARTDESGINARPNDGCCKQTPGKAKKTQ
ncbi:MAG: hypothetical protein Q9209_001857 [Squamulea sp. 1 TL-2023]